MEMRRFAISQAIRTAHVHQTVPSTRVLYQNHVGESLNFQLICVILGKASICAFGRQSSTTSSVSAPSHTVPARPASTFAEEIQRGPGLADFIRTAAPSTTPNAPDVEFDLPSSFPKHLLTDDNGTQLCILYLLYFNILFPLCSVADKRKVFMETYGCQMNASDSEIVMSIMLKAGYEETAVLDEVPQMLSFLPSWAAHMNAWLTGGHHLCEYVRHSRQCRAQGLGPAQPL
jgi:hypothetical protein